MGTEVEQNRKATRGSLKKGSGLLMSISVIGFLFSICRSLDQLVQTPHHPRAAFPETAQPDKPDSR